MLTKVQGREVFHIFHCLFLIFEAALALVSFFGAFSIFAHRTSEICFDDAPFQTFWVFIQRLREILRNGAQLFLSALSSL